MKQIAEKLVRRNYRKRILSILIAAVVLLVAVGILIPVTLRRQIAEFRALEDAREQQEETDAADAADAAAGTAEEQTERKHDGKEQKLKAILRQLTPVGKGTKAAFAAVALLAFLLGVFYWITVAEWLYKVAVTHGLNRALWPMLGLVFNLLTLPLLLIVLCDPKRVQSAAQA